MGVTNEIPRIKVLIADDNPVIRSQLEKSLNDYFEVFTAKNGSEALEIIKEKGCHVLITDIIMPEISGLDLIQSLKDVPKKPAILVISGVNDPNIRAELYYNGAIGFINKPFSPEEIRQSIFNLLSVEKTVSDSLENIKNTFATVLTHELRTPLVAISAGSEVLIKEVDNPTLVNIIQSIKKSGQRLEKLISNMTIFQQIQLGIVGKLANQRKGLFSIENIINKSMRLLYEDIIEVSPVFVFKGDYFSAKIEVNENQITTALSKIFENCLKFSKPKPVIQVETAIKGQQDSLEVILNITSLNSKYPAGYDETKIQPFYQPERKTLEQQGAGLGLYIAKVLTIINNGKFKIFNSEKGAVSQFRFTLKN